MLVGGLIFIYTPVIFDLLFYLVYAIEATVHAPSWEGVYGEIFKVLKPGGVVSPIFHYQPCITIELQSTSLESMNGA